MGSPTWRNIELSPTGSVLVPLRFISKNHFDCFLQELAVGAVFNDTGSILYHNGTLLGLPNFYVDLGMMLNAEQVRLYNQNSLPYQGKKKLFENFK